MRVAWSVESLLGMRCHLRAVIEIPRPATARAGGWSAFGLGPQFQSIDVTPGSRPLRVVAREFDEAQDQLERGPIGQGGGGR